MSPTDGSVVHASGADVLSSLTGLFPLAPSVRPTCPALGERVEQVRDLTRQAQRSAKDEPDAEPGAASASQAGPRPVLRTAARALNLAALVASDCRSDGLFERIAWDHVNTYLSACSETGRRLDEEEATCLLVPVTAIARLRLRESNPRSGVRALTRLLAALRSRTEVTIEGHTLHLGGLLPLPRPTAGTSRSWDQRATGWMWRQLVTHGSTALTATGRWSEAENLVRSHKGGPGLDEGRQAAILGRYSVGDLTSARRLLDDAILTTRWERQVAASLRLLLATHSERDHAATTLAEMFTRTTDDVPGATVELHSCLAAVAAHLLAMNQHSAAATVATNAAQRVVAEPNGYAARHLLHSPAVTALLPATDAEALDTIVTQAGLTGEAYNSDVRRRLSDTTYSARKVLEHALETTL